jgi:tape measure domain-containing protein
MSDKIEWDISARFDKEPAATHYNNLLQSAVAGNRKAQEEVNRIAGGTIKKKMEVQIDMTDSGAKVTTVQKEILSQWDKIAKGIKRAEQTQKGSLTSLKGELRLAAQRRDGLKKTVGTTKRYGVVVGKVTAEWKAQNKVVQDLNRKVADVSGNWMKMIQARIPGGQNIMAMANGLTQIGFAVGGVVAGFQAINQAITPVVNRAKQLQGLQLAMEGFGLSTEQAQQFMDQAKSQAFKYGASLNQIEKGYKRIAPAILNAGGSMQDTSDAMASLSARSTTLGLNAEKSGRYFEAFAQVMGKGKLQGEELNQQFSELDGALRGQIASYLKATQGITDFEGAMQKGQITSKLFLEAFNAISADMRENLAGSIGEVQERIDSLNIEQIDNLSNSLNSITLESLGETFGNFGKQMMSVKLMIEQFFANIATTMPGVQKLVQVVMAVIGGAIQATVVGALGLLRFLLHGIETVVNGWMLLAQAFVEFVKLIPGGQALIDALVGTFSDVVTGLQKFTDSWLGVGKESLKAEQDLSTVDGRILELTNRFNSGKITAEEYAAGIAEIRAEAQRAIDMGELEKLTEKVEELKEKVKEATQAEEGAQSAFDAEKEKLSALKEGVKQYFDEKKAALDQQKEATTQAYDAEIANIKRAQEAQASRHEAEMSNLEQRNEAVQASIQSEIDALGGKTPAEEKLAQMRKEEIMDKLRSNDLSEKEKLQLQAQLERMERQKQIEEAQLRLKAAKENAAKTEAALAERQKEEQEELAQAEEEANEAKKAALDEIKEKQKALVEQQKRITELMDESKNITDLTGQSIGEITAKVKSQVASYNEAKDALSEAKDETSDMKTQLEAATQKAKEFEKELQAVAKQAGKAAAQWRGVAAAKQSAAAVDVGSPGGGKGQKPTLTGGAAGMMSNNGVRAAGGPVIGGGRYTVNELGAEGFMSTSGRLSAIKAPAFGQWTAPGSGTVIPAHVWAGMKAQSNAASGGGMPSAAGQSGGMMARLSALGRAGSSDVVTNNVTIQSENVDQTLQQSLVSLRRIKRARYY